MLTNHHFFLVFFPPFLRHLLTVNDHVEQLTLSSELPYLYQHVIRTFPFFILFIHWVLLSSQHALLTCSYISIPVLNHMQHIPPSSIFPLCQAIQIHFSFLSVKPLIILHPVFTLCYLPCHLMLHLPLFLSTLFLLYLSLLFPVDLFL